MSKNKFARFICFYRQPNARLPNINIECLEIISFKIQKIMKSQLILRHFTDKNELGYILHPINHVSKIVKYIGQEESAI